MVETIKNIKHGLAIQANLVKLACMLTIKGYEQGNVIIEDGKVKSVVYKKKRR